MFAAAEYVRGAVRNAGILIRLAEAAKNDPDPAVSAAAEKLLDNALDLRLYAFQVVPRLYMRGAGSVDQSRASLGCRKI